MFGRRARLLAAACAIGVAAPASPALAAPLAHSAAPPKISGPAAYAGDAVVGLGREGDGPPVRLLHGANSSGATNRVQLADSGFDTTDVTVVFPRIGGPGGTVTLSPTGDTYPPACAPLSWKAIKSDEHVTVRCNTNVLEPAAVHVSFTRARHPSGFLAYAFANQPGKHGYTPTRTYQYARSGRPMTVTRLGRGQYQVRIPHILTKHAAVQVTGVGPSLNACRVLSWKPVTKAAFADVLVRVACGPQWSAPQDTPFTISYTACQSLLGLGGKAYGWVYDMTPKAKLTTPTQWTASGAKVHVERTGVGRYAVTGAGLHAAVICSEGPGFPAPAPFVLHWAGSFLQITTAGAAENVCVLTA